MCGIKLSTQERKNNCKIEQAYSMAATEQDHAFTENHHKHTSTNNRQKHCSFKKNTLNAFKNPSSSSSSNDVSSSPTCSRSSNLFKKQCKLLLLANV